MDGKDQIGRLFRRPFQILAALYRGIPVCGFGGQCPGVCTGAFARTGAIAGTRSLRPYRSLRSAGAFAGAGTLVGVRALAGICTGGYLHPR